MSGQLIPLPELDHPLRDDLTMGQRIAVYLDLLEATEQMLIAGLRATLPAGADMRAELQRVYDRQSEEHYRGLVRMAERFNRMKEQHGSSGGA